MINFLLNDDEHWFLLLTKSVTSGLGPGHGGGGGGGGPTSRKKLKISKRAVKALAARKLPQTFLGLDKWVKQNARLAREALALPIKLPPTIHAFSTEFLEKLALDLANSQAQKEQAATERMELLVSIFLVRVTLLQAQAIAKYREEEEILLLYMLSS